MKKLPSKFHRRCTDARDDGISYQSSITFFLEDGEETPGYLIKILYVKSLNMCVPYIAVPDRFGKYEPLQMDSDTFPEVPKDILTLRKTKMRRFRYELPYVISCQYRYAELMKIPGFDNRHAIESGAVIRLLLQKVDKRLYYLNHTGTFNTYPIEA